MSVPDAFFTATGEVLAVLRDHAARPAPPVRTRPLDERHTESAESLLPTAAVWNPLVRDLLRFEPEVLEYVAAMCRARDGLVGRRVVAALGSSRGNGLLGLLLSALALAATWNVLRGWFPESPAGLFVLGFVLSLWGVLYIGASVLSGGHNTSRLLYYADVLDATVKLKGAWAERGSLPE